MGLWDGKFSNLKISEHSSPELYKELESMSARDRGERLRALALIGLQSLRLSIHCTANKDGHVREDSSNKEGVINNAAENDRKKTAAINSAQKMLKEKLIGSLESQ